jgi:hypothetical protein
MDTPKSNSGGSWSACALIFSGRPQPNWPLAEGDARALIALWDALPISGHKMPDVPALGYRGCAIVDGKGGEWRAYGGVAVSTSGTANMARADGERKFERAILATAPPDVISPGLIGL